MLDRPDKLCPAKCVRSLSVGDTIVENRHGEKSSFRCTYCGFKTDNEHELLNAMPTPKRKLTKSRGPSSVRKKR
jgi:lipopolysaccharide biosynthesis regulator YciM